MKVLMIAPQPWFSPRGTPFSVLHRLRTLSKLGHHIDLVTYPIGENVPIKNVTINRTAKVPFFKKIVIGPSKRKLIFDWFLYRKATALLKQHKYDLIHTHEEAGFFAPILARKFNLLHLYDMHSSLPQQLTNFKYTQLRGLISLFERFERYTITNAEAVITICPELYNYVKKLYPDKFNMLIENVADNSQAFSENQIPVENLRNEYQLNGQLVVVYAGTFEHYQGIDLLIESSQKVLAKHKNVKLCLVGGSPAQVEKYQALVSAKNLSAHYIFTGSVKPEEVPNFVNLADILVSPRIEGNNTPLKIYSYLRSGRPIVATRHITHTQVLNDEVSVLTDVTPIAFAEGILSVIEDQALRTKISQNAQRLAEEKYSYEVYVKKTREVYDYLESKLTTKGTQG